jgi:ketosteroid isomerase-like protein
MITMKKYFFVFLLVIVFGTKLSAQNKEERKMIVAAVMENDRKLEEFFKASNADSIAELFSPNCNLIAEYSKQIEKREEVAAFYKQVFKSGISYADFELEAEEHKVYDDLVLEFGVNTIKFSKGGGKTTTTEKLNYMLVWKKSKTGTYQIRAAMWNSVRNPCE